MNSDGDVLIILIQILMGLVSLIGGAMIMSINSAVKELRKTDEKLADEMRSYAKAEELQRWRQEQREENNQMRQEQIARFDRIFEKLDNIQKDLSNKVDR